MNFEFPQPFAVILILTPLSANFAVVKKEIFFPTKWNIQFLADKNNYSKYYGIIVSMVSTVSFNRYRIIAADSSPMDSLSV